MLLTLPTGETNRGERSAQPNALLRQGIQYQMLRNQIIFGQAYQLCTLAYPKIPIKNNRATTLSRPRRVIAKPVTGSS
ncbi:MAG: hypothetical protein GY820_15095 [Gammaproteobacteria bacterium]|nr:hypothetical protein [Gammaproteobacteria bacterium]